MDLVSEYGIEVRAVPGGSVLNASVSLGRMGIEVHLLSETGDDKAGKVIVDFLKNNGVHTGSIIRHANRKTSLALAFLDSKKNATYTFYHDSPEQLPEIKVPSLRSADILLFGSFYAVKPNRRGFVLKILQKAVERKSLIYYDLNIRKTHAGEMDSLESSFMKNMAVASIVKGSDDDFMHLFGLKDPGAIYAKVSPYCKILIITRGSKPVHVFTPNFNRKYDVPVITPVSTIGAGDNFNAGFLYGLINSGIDAKNLEEIPVNELDRMVACGLAFAAETCLSTGNYIPVKFEPDFWKRYI